MISTGWVASWLEPAERHLRPLRQRRAPAAPRSIATSQPAAHHGRSSLARPADRIPAARRFRKRSGAPRRSSAAGATCRLPELIRPSGPVVSAPRRRRRRPRRAGRASPSRRRSGSRRRSRSSTSPLRSSRWVGMSRSPVAAFERHHRPVVQLDRRRRASVIAARSGGAASGTTSVGGEAEAVLAAGGAGEGRVRDPAARSPSASTSPGENDHAADPVVGLHQEQRRQQPERHQRQPHLQDGDDPRMQPRPGRHRLRRRRRAGSRGRAGCPPAARRRPARWRRAW